jgi:delta1-piperideine-2-carboxylate reductase
MSDASGVSRLAWEDLVALLHAIFERHGVPTRAASILAENCAAAERDGASSHGIFRIPGYVSTLHSGYVDARAEPVIEEAAPAFLSVDARNGFAQVALDAVRGAATEKARKYGVVVATVRRSHHLGALWLDVEPYARRGLIAITYRNGISRVAPYGGHKAFYGTNPMALAVPRRGSEPLVFDQASSAMSYGEVRIAELEGRQVPPGTGIDSHRSPSTDPAAILNGGALLPYGGYKGSSIAMMVELLAGALTGSHFSCEVDRSPYPGAETSCSGQLLLVIDPAAHSAGADYADRVEDLVRGLHASGQSRLPGDRRYQRRRSAALHGIPIANRALEELRSLIG